MKKKLHAIVLGATGATGQELVKQLLYNSNFSEISVFTRKTFSIDHEKLNKNKIDFSKRDNYKSLVIGDVFFGMYQRREFCLCAMCGYPEARVQFCA